MPYLMTLSLIIFIILEPHPHFMIHVSTHSTSAHVMAAMKSVVILLLSFSFTFGEEFQDPSLTAEGGYFKREHSLSQPYQGRGMDVSN